MPKEKSNEQPKPTPTDEQSHFTSFFSLNLTHTLLITRFLSSEELAKLASTCKTNKEACEKIEILTYKLSDPSSHDTYSLADLLLREADINNDKSLIDAINKYQHETLIRLGIVGNNSSTEELKSFMSYIDNQLKSHEISQFFDCLPADIRKELAENTRMGSSTIPHKPPLLNAVISYIIKYSLRLKQKLVFDENNTIRGLAPYHKLCQHLESVLTAIAICYSIYIKKISHKEIINHVIDLIINNEQYKFINGHCLILLDYKISQMTEDKKGYLDKLLYETHLLQIKEEEKKVTLYGKNKLNILHLSFKKFTRTDFINLVTNRYKSDHVTIFEGLLCVNELNIPRQAWLILISRNIDKFYKATQYDELKYLTDNELCAILSNNDFKMLDLFLYHLRSDEERANLISIFCSRLNNYIILNLFNLLLDNYQKDRSTKKYYLFHFYTEFVFSTNALLNKLSDEEIKKVFLSSHQYWFKIPDPYPGLNPYWINTYRDDSNPKEKCLWERLSKHPNFRKRLCHDQCKLTHDLALISEPIAESLILPEQLPLLKNLTSSELQSIADKHHNGKIASLDTKKIHQASNHKIPRKKILSITILVIIAAAGLALSFTGIGASLGAPMAIKSMAGLATFLGVSIKAATIVSITTGLTATLVSTTTNAIIQIKKPFDYLKEKIANSFNLSPPLKTTQCNQINSDLTNLIQPKYTNNSSVSPSAAAQPPVHTTVRSSDVASQGSDSPRFFTDHSSYHQAQKANSANEKDHRSTCCFIF